MKKSFSFLLLLLAVFSLYGSTPKYIFLFIGDGMALPQRLLAEELSRKTGKGRLLMNSFPFHATTRTVSANSLTTDSAAAATAIACGVKTDNKRIGTDPQNNKLYSVAEMARDKGRKVGIITTVTLNHATPAGFYGHRKSRTQYYDLASDLLASRFDFFGGGGIAEHNKRSPGIFELAEKNDYRIFRGRKGLAEMTKEGRKIFFASSEKSNMPYAMDLDSNTPALADITEKAIEVLDNPNGFFLMVEGGLIDYAGHGNEAGANAREVIALDHAVRKAYKFYEKHPSETLIIVTGDHETGGLTLGVTGKKFTPEVLANQKCSAGKFREYLNKMQQTKKDLSFEEIKVLITEKFGFVFSSGNKKDPMLVNEKELKELQEGFAKKKLHNAIRILQNRKAGVNWSTGSHTALPVLTTAVGCNAEKFSGFIENT
ncbi:MAG: alkaline phosphatase, partial [Lentisphaeria bacterium]|nr:alkaline phosphatase [Lentisphaeria bacterium]